MILTAFSNFLIPLLTLLLARGTNWFSTNFSSIRSSFSRQGEFLIWSLSTGCYFYFCLNHILKKRALYHDTKKETALFFSSACLMALFVFTPYLPAQFPFLSILHVLSAMASSGSFFACLLLLLLKSYLEYPKEYGLKLIALYFAAIFCICSFLLTGIINSAMEICFVITCSLLLKRLSISDQTRYP